MMSHKQPVKMDSRKFLASINDSAQAKIAMIESHVRTMGNEIGKNWKLAALHAKELFIEDTDTHEYFVAKHMRDKNRINITDIEPIQIVEEEKKSLFEESAMKLITALESNDQRAMASAFEKLKAQRFSSRTVPFSGVVKCKDNVRRFVNIQDKNSLGESVRNKLVAAIVESLSNNVIVENGHVVAGMFDTEQVKLPVTKWGARKLVARRMRDAANSAYVSEGFQTRILNLARCINDGKIEEAVKSISGFLDENEEFTLLTRAQTQTLVENALAAKCIFNQRLCDDTATLLHRTNLKVNRSKIIDEWRNIAKRSEHPVLANNVHVLEESKNFESSHSKFLTLIFESISNKDVAAEALATTLNVLKDKTPKIRESFELSSKLDGLIRRLKQNDIDDAAIYEAEDLIATIQEELSAADTLNDFDQMPGDAGTPGDQIDDPLAGNDTASGAPVININSPLIQIGGSSGAIDEPELDSLDQSDEPSGDPELDALLGDDSQQPAPPPAPAPAPAPQQQPTAQTTGQPLMQGFENNGNVLYEQSNDPYYIKSGDNTVLNSSRFFDYGSPIITDSNDLNKIATVMHRLAVENKLTGSSLDENIVKLAKASIEAVGIRIPAGKLNGAIDQVISVYNEEWKKPWLDDESDDESDDEESVDNENDDDEEGVAEDQFKFPYRKPRGFARSSYKKRTPTAKSESASKNKKALSESINWLQVEQDAMLGELSGVKFIFDHGMNKDLEPAILSEDGGVEIPIPQHLHEEAFAAAQMADGKFNKFIGWLSESIEQLRPISDREHNDISEAVATITASPDGALSVEVTPDVAVDDIDGEMTDVNDEFDVEGDENSDFDMEDDMDMEGGMDDGMEGGMDDGMEGGMDDGMEDGMDDGMEGGMEDGEFGDDFGGEEEMQPVDVTDVDGNDGTDESDDSVPDFESGSGIGDESGGRDDQQEVEFEDKDITTPSSTKYTTHVKENPRKVSKPTKPKDSGDNLESIGPDLKVDDGSGTNPPFAKKGSK